MFHIFIYMVYKLTGVFICCKVPLALIRDIIKLGNKMNDEKCSNNCVKREKMFCEKCGKNVCHPFSGDPLKAICVVTGHYVTPTGIKCMDCHDTEKG